MDYEKVYKVYDKIIYSYEMDYQKHLPPSAMLRVINGGYYGAMGKLGMRYVDISSKMNATHMNGMTDLHIFKPVQVFSGEQTVELYATPVTRTKGVFMARIYLLLQGEVIAMLDQVSMIVSMETHRVLPTEYVTQTMGCEVEQSPIGAPRRLQIPEDMELAREVQVRYSECDINRHMNTSRYIDHICETLGYWEGNLKIMNRLRIEFNSECVPGDTLGIYVKQTDNGWYVKGMKNRETLSFKAYVEMKEVEA